MRVRGAQPTELEHLRVAGLNLHWQMDTQPREGSTCPRSHSKPGAALTPQNNINILGIIQGALQPSPAPGQALRLDRAALWPRLRGPQRGPKKTTQLGGGVPIPQLWSIRRLLPLPAEASLGSQH